MGHFTCYPKPVLSQIIWQNRLLETFIYHHLPGLGMFGVACPIPWWPKLLLIMMQMVVQFHSCRTCETRTLIVAEEHQRSPLLGRVKIQCWKIGVPQSEMAFPVILKWHQGFLHLLNLLAFADWIDLRRITNITVISHHIIPAIYLQYKSITVHLHPNIFLYKNDKVSAWPPRRCAGSFRQHLEPSDPGWPRWKKTGSEGLTDCDQKLFTYIYL